MANRGTVHPSWYHVDAADHVLGRLAVQIARVLMGKHKPTYTPHVDTGDYVVVTNAAKIKLTGNKIREMTYDGYSRYPGGHKSVPAQRVLDRHPERLIQESVRRMLPKNALGRRMLKKLRVFRGNEHPHTAQQPQEWSF